MAKPASDAILLERFARGREQAAFEAIVNRHGPLVERVCRRFLRNEQDVEDVFQATFLILARKAAALPWQESVGGWLSAVAERLAMHARSGAARQRNRETSITTLTGGGAEANGRLPEQYHPTIDSAAEVERLDLRRIIDDELLNLPEKYRAPMILCYLEGRTHEEAARQLGWPTGSMSRRLNRARTLLRLRLAHRGLAITIVLLISGAFIALGFNRIYDDAVSARVVRQAMSPFQSSSTSQNGLELTLAALVRADNPPPQTAEVIGVARRAAEAARQIKGYNSGPLRTLWLKYAGQMESSAAAMEQACHEDDRPTLIASARRLESSCLNCHEIFR